MDEFDLFAVKSKKANKTNSSLCFLGESMARQFAFEINWPLVHPINRNLYLYRLLVLHSILLSKPKLIGFQAKLILLTQKLHKWGINAIRIALAEIDTDFCAHRKLYFARFFLRREWKGPDAFRNFLGN